MISPICFHTSEHLTSVRQEYEVMWPSCVSTRMEASVGGLHAVHSTRLCLYGHHLVQTRGNHLVISSQVIWLHLDNILTRMSLCIGDFLMFPSPPSLWWKRLCVTQLRVQSPGERVPTQAEEPARTGRNWTERGPHLCASPSGIQAELRLLQHQPAPDGRKRLNLKYLKV